MWNLALNKRRRNLSKLFASSIITICFITQVGQLVGQNSFFDDFNDNSINTSYWQPNPAAGSIAETNHRMEFRSRGYLTTQAQFDPNEAAIEVSGTWTNVLGPQGVNRDYFQLLTRSDGVPVGAFNETRNGIEFMALPGNSNAGGSIKIIQKINGVNTTLATAPVNYSIGDTIQFMVRDDGSNLTFSFTPQGTSMPVVLNAKNSTSYSVNHVVFHNRENNNGSATLSYMDDVIVAHGTEPLPTQIGALADLERLQTIHLAPLVQNSNTTFPSEIKRAEQGIFWDGQRWITSQGQSVPAFATQRLFSVFSNDWSQLTSDFSETSEVVHIGDIAGHSGSIYAPIQVRVGFEIIEFLVRYDTSTWKNTTWFTPDGITIAGLEYFEGEIFGVENRGNQMPINILVFDPENLEHVKRRYQVGGLPDANGIAICNDRLFVTSGDLNDGEELIFGTQGRIFVFDLNDFLAEPRGALDAELNGYGIYDFTVPGNLHAEGITFRNEEMWVGLGSIVAELDYSSVSSHREEAVDKNGNWQQVFDNQTDEQTIAVVSNSNLLVDGDAICGNLITVDNASCSIQEGGNLTVDRTVGICNGVVSVDAGVFDVGICYIGKPSFDEGPQTANLLLGDGSSPMVVRGRLELRDFGSLTTSNGTIDLVGADFINLASDGSPYSDLSKLTIRFKGGPERANVLELGSKNIGGAGKDAKQNFRVHRLSVEQLSRVVLTDKFNNQRFAFSTDIHRSISEALYLNELDVQAGSILVLNHLPCYVNGIRIQPGDGASYGGGKIIQQLPTSRRSFAN